MRTSRHAARSFDPSLVNLYDAVHGAIDLRDISVNPGSCALLRLLSTPLLDRLRRIKLLGYASHRYPSADHSRYAHALGSMHVMRCLIDRVGQSLTQQPALIADLKRFGRPVVKTQEDIQQHMLIAALLQDVGELPYGQATARVFRPSPQLFKSVQDETGLETRGWREKDVFGIASLYSEPYCKASALNLSFLVFLMTGRLSGNPTPSLLTLRQMLEGEVDADRLDYVYRDAYHTVGGRGTPQAVIDSLLRYDEHGPVFSDPGPVSEFFATRASLWTTVYFAAENRFRLLLLLTLLRGILRDKTLAKVLFGEECNGSISFEFFKELDDISLHARIRAFSENKAHTKLEGRARTALEVLLGKAEEYECFWLPPGVPRPPTPSPVAVPPSLFFDSCLDHEVNHTLYERGSVRVQADRFRYIAKTPIPLEECCGAFSEILKQPWSALERQGSFLIFKPRQARDVHWERVLAELRDRTLFHTLEELDPLNPLEPPSDTRARRGYTGRAVFISFCWADIKVVRRFVAELDTRRQRYFLLLHHFDGLGGTPGDNSSQCVMEADCVIVLVSAKYVQRFFEKGDGNIARELHTLGLRVRNEGLPVTYLAVDPKDELTGFPHTVAGLPELPFVGTVPLREASDEALKAAVDAALASLEKGGPSAKTRLARAKHRRTR